MNVGTKTYEITVQKLLAATAEQVFAAFTDAATWNEVHVCHATELDLSVGGKVVVRFFADRPGGETFVFREIDAPRRLVFHWEGQAETTVTVRIEAAEHGVIAKVTQACGSEPDWIANCLDGWAWVLDSLEHYLETGHGLPHPEWAKRHGTHAIVRRAEEPEAPGA